MGKLGRTFTILTLGIIDFEDWGDYFQESVDVKIDEEPAVTTSRGVMLLNFLIIVVIIALILIAVSQPDCTGSGINLCTY